MVEAALVALSVTLGLVVLPPFGIAPPPSQAAIKAIAIFQSANVPTYLFDEPADNAGRLNVLRIGMDVPATMKQVYWTLLIQFAHGDSATKLQVSNGSSVEQNSRGVLAISGTMNGGSDSYTEFQPGYRQAQNYPILANEGAMSHYAWIHFDLAGPVPSHAVAGPRLTVEEPAIYDAYENGVPASVQRETPAPFTSEVLYDAGSYELEGSGQGSGPTVTGSPDNNQWDWINQGRVVLPVSAIGVNNDAEQGDQYALFLAGALFGVAGAAGAALALELVDAFKEHRRAKRLSEVDAF